MIGLENDEAKRSADQRMFIHSSHRMHSLDTAEMRVFGLYRISGSAEVVGIKQVGLEFGEALSNQCDGFGEGR